MAGFVDKFKRMWDAPMMSMSTMNMVMLTKVQKKTIKKNL